MPFKSRQLESNFKQVCHAGWILLLAFYCWSCLAPVFADNQNPRVMLLIDEKNLGSIATAEIEAMATSKLLQNRIPTVDQEMVRANIKKDQALLQMAGDNQGAAAIGLQFGADIVIVGEAVAKPSAKRIAESNLRTYQAVVTLRAVHTDNSLTIGSASETATAIGLEDVSGSSKALKLAGQKALDNIIPQIMNSWEGDGDGSPRTVVLNFGGVDQVWKLKAIRQMLRKHSEWVSNVRQNSYTAGVAIFQVEAQLPTESLSEQMVINPPDGLRFQVLDLSSGKINLKAVNS